MCGRSAPRSILCLPIVKQAKLLGALYLENNLTAGAFTPDRVTVLQLLASQAAISLENATLYSDLQLQAGLLQRLPVSAWTLKPDGTPDFVNQVWLEFSGQTLDFVRSHPEAWMTAVHPEDREAAARAFWEGVHRDRVLRSKPGLSALRTGPIAGISNKPWSCAMQKEKSSNSSVRPPTSTTRSVPKRRLRDEAVRYNISVRTELAADLPQIVGDRVQLQQVAMNLIVNSIEAMKDVDGIREMVIKSQRAENEQILVSVSDTGIGFPPQLAEQIFDPFFTTKPHGTGMGLRISRSIIESHGGRLWAVGSPGRGATFHLNLPCVIIGTMNQPYWRMLWLLNNIKYPPLIHLRESSARPRSARKERQPREFGMNNGSGESRKTGRGTWRLCDSVSVSFSSRVRACG
jgi:PAS domain-containing protein